MGHTQKLAEGSWRFELFYWDYVIGMLLLSVLFAFTMGSVGSYGRSFVMDIQQADNASSKRNKTLVHHVFIFLCRIGFVGVFKNQVAQTSHESYPS